MSKKPEKANEGGRKRERDPGKRQDEQDRDDPFERGDGTDRNDLEHLISAVGGERQGAAEHGEAGQDRRLRKGRRDQRAAIPGRKSPKGLRGHRERRKTGHRSAQRRARLFR